MPYTPNPSATVNSGVLRNLIQSEENNQQCLRELESRINALESSNKMNESRRIEKPGDESARYGVTGS